MENTKLGTKLKHKNLSLTQQRRVILEELEKSEDHLTADQIYFIVKKRMPRVSVGTIYRNLTVLVSLHLIDKLDTSLHKESHYESHKEDHYHIVCTKCLRIDDLEHYRALSIEPTAAKISGYKISNHRIELQGLCPKCKKYAIESNVPEQKNIYTETLNQTEIKTTEKVITPTQPKMPETQPAIQHTQTPHVENNHQNSPKQQNNNEIKKAPFQHKSKKRRFFFGRRNSSN